MKTNSSEKFVIDFDKISKKDIALVGGKNASIGELIHTLKPKGINVPDGFAVTSLSYWEFIYSNKLKEPIKKILDKLDRKEFKNLETISFTIRELIRESKMPDEIAKAIKLSYFELCKKYTRNTDVAIRSSATAEDLPTASFAGMHESFLNVQGDKAILHAVVQCYASLFNERAIKYRHDKGFDLLNIAQSVGIQKMVRSDIECSGVCFTIEPNTGFRDVIHITGSWGLGENVVKGVVNPDEFLIYKKTLLQGFNGIIKRKLGTKDITMIYADNTNHRPDHNTVNIKTSKENRESFILNDIEINQLAQWAIMIESHYDCPMDLEWAKDGFTNDLYIVQARPETAHRGETTFLNKEYTILKKTKKITEGIAVGNKITSGKARVLVSPSESQKLLPGEILVTDITNPDWDVALKKTSAIVTNKGGRTSHASIVARELGVPAIVGTNDATQKIKNGQLITVSCAEGQTGFIYDGKAEWTEKEYDIRNIKMPVTKIMLIVSDPEHAFQLSSYPNNGIGLMRLEFVISNSIRIHPMALAQFDKIKSKSTRNKIDKLTFNYEDKGEYFIDKLSQAVATTAAAFYPKEVIVRMSDFKTNEYANLIGGNEFEPKEENPMIGFRGASRYYNERYVDGFELECKAMKRVREEMGFTNVKLMIPFCRTVEEAQKVLKQMEKFGLKRGKNKLEIYMMVEVPSNVILAEKFAKYFDGFSIGSNDLTQLTLGIDRDSSIINEMFNETDDASKEMIATVIQKAKKAGIQIGLCGQAPSDFPEFAGFLVQQGIGSISFNPDALLNGIKNVHEAEKTLLPKEKPVSL